VKKLLISFCIAINYFASALAQPATFAQTLKFVDSAMNKNPKISEAAIAHFDVGAYGVCANAGLAVAAGDVKGEDIQKKLSCTQHSSLRRPTLSKKVPLQMEHPLQYLKIPCEPAAILDIHRTNGIGAFNGAP